MTKKILILFIPVLILPIFLAGCAVSLASDVTPPPNAESYTAQDTPVASQSTFPIVPADPSRGEAIYNEKCADCHGQTGLGDGPQAGQLPVPVPALADPAIASSAKPAEWFNLVTQGNLEKFMPGFQSLDDRQRWDVVAYALTLSIDQQQLAMGRAVYAVNCENCHGKGGQGSTDAPSWLEDATRLAQYSLNDIVSIATNGINSMPAFGSTLSQAEIQTASIYTRSLSFTNYSGQIAQIEPTLQATSATPEAASTPASPSIVTIQGKVTNASGGVLPDGLQAVLTGFEGMNQVSEQQTDVKDGVYRFEQVEIVPGDTYMVSIHYQGLTFDSDVYHTTTSPTENTVDLPINFYDTTSDVSALRADRMHIFFDFINPETVQVVELLILNNTGNRVIVPAQAGTGVVSYDLPEGATNLQFEDSTIGERYLQTDKGFADTTNIGPGTGEQILFAYDLPYSRKMSLEVPIPMDVDAAVVMVPAGTMKMKSDQLQSAGQQDVQGVSLELYTTSALTKGSVLAMNLSGSSNSGLSLQVGKTSGLLIGAAALGVALLLAGYWLLRQRKSGKVLATAQKLPSQESAEELMDAIIALDDRYKAGDIPDEAYQSRRNDLKEQLSSKMK